MSLKQALLRWLFAQPKSPEPNLAPGASVAVDSQPSMDLLEGSTTNIRLQIAKAVNGHIVTVSKFKHNPHGPDWTHQHFLVKEDDDLMDAVKTCITIGVL